ncbi:hypothetical protein [Streptomyces sp. ME19-01-6]|uniref:hypothetical protein n=1 Tax=Streptomyces sp. ME19-01-6 TaxID=3028686 RepID=UPI0029B9270D|nr:hypothetical protein [Streptomyces sp. ME19-01-6]MDX3230601.1 hypothetical protein [Streptomyces sp. ME19-01-6]
MAMYEPGGYEFEIVFLDPNRRLKPHPYFGTILVERRMSESDVAQMLLTWAKRGYRDIEVLHLPNPGWTLKRFECFRKGVTKRQLLGRSRR